jgi:hypothetical protein
LQWALKSLHSVLVSYSRAVLQPAKSARAFSAVLS